MKRIDVITNQSAIFNEIGENQPSSSVLKQKLLLNITINFLVFGIYSFFSKKSTENAKVMTLILHILMLGQDKYKQTLLLKT